MGKSHRLITVFFHIGLMPRSLFHMFLVQGARLHVLRCQLQRAQNQKCDDSSHGLIFLRKGFAGVPAFFTASVSE